MASSLKDVDLQYVASPPSGGDPVAFSRSWGFQTSGSPVTQTATGASFRIESTKKELELTLGAGLTWNNTTKYLTCQITNSQLAFIKNGTDYTFSLIVELYDGTTTTQIPMGGNVNASRVA